MIDKKMTDAIVPIYCEGEFNGTGFLYKSFLITAAHVVEGFKEVSYVYHGDLLQVTEVEMIYCKRFGKERDEYGRVIFNALTEDLAIYRINDYCDSLELAIDPIDDGTEALLYGYHYIDDAIIPMEHCVVKMMNDCNVDNHWLFPQDYCLYCRKTNDKFDIIKGYSGGPVLIGERVVGMLFGEIQESGTLHLMKSSRIYQVISRFEGENLQNSL